MKKPETTKRQSVRKTSVSTRQRRPQPTKGRSAEPRTILVPIDFSSNSLRALEIAGSLARKFDAALVLVHAIDAIYTQGRFDSPRLRPLRAEARQHAQERLEKLAKDGTLESLRPVKHQLIDGSPSEAILAFAKKAGADWIVMGSKGQTGMKRLFAGSVAERVVRLATCPVLVVA